MPILKSDAIYKWKKSGLICDDYNALYETYIETMECQHCKTEFTKKNWRCLDHDHETGLFRKIVCNRCNVNDSYINYPNGYSKKEYNQEYQQKNKEKISERKKEYRQKNKEKIRQYQQAYRQTNKQKILEQNKEKIECECGSIVRRREITKHHKTKKHSDYKLNNLL